MQNLSRWSIQADVKYFQLLNDLNMRFFHSTEEK